jgi:hypothetical protein
MSGIDPALIGFYERIEAAELPVFIGGSVGSSLWGEPRSTLDIDLVIAAGREDAERLVAACPADRFYVPPLEVVRRELARGGEGSFNIIDMETSLKADCYPQGADDLNRYGFATAVEIDLEDLGRVRVASPTYLVARKLRYFAMGGQDKHLRDIRGIIQASGDRLDQAAIEAWASESGTLQAWRACRDRVGEE